MMIVIAEHAKGLYLGVAAILIVVALLCWGGRKNGPGRRG